MRKSAKLTGWLCAALLAAGCGTSAASSATPAQHPTAAALHVQAETAEQITAAMQREGFKTGKVTAYTAATDPNDLLGRQGGYTSMAGWSLADNTLNSVEVYPDAAEATKRVAYLNLFTGGLIGSYVYQDGYAILMVSPSLTPTQAAAAHTDFVKAVGA
jgi:hypothetical protein